MIPSAMAGQAGHSLQKGSLVKPSPCICPGGLTRACKSTLCMQAGKAALQKRSRVQGRRSRAQRHNAVVLSAAAQEDVIDVSGTVVDNRIPVTVSEDHDDSKMHSTGRSLEDSSVVLGGILTISVCRSSLAFWVPARPPC